jgi:hypothetical protein
MFCAPGLFFSVSEGIGSRFHVLRSRTRSRRYRGRRVPFSCYALPDSFSAVPRVSDPIFLYCAPGLFFDVTEGVESRFHVFAPGLIFGGTEGVRSHFHVLRSWNRFRRYRERRVPFSCFARPDSFSTVLRASGPVFMFPSPGLVFGGIGGVESRFHVLRSRTRFRR